MSDEHVDLYDAADDDAFCEGDPDPTDIDWDAVARLKALQADAGDDETKNLGLLAEMYGDDLEVL